MGGVITYTSDCVRLCVGPGGYEQGLRIWGSDEGLGEDMEESDETEFQFAELVVALEAPGLVGESRSEYDGQASSRS